MTHDTSLYSPTYSTGQRSILDHLDTFSLLQRDSVSLSLSFLIESVAYFAIA